MGLWQCSEAPQNTAMTNTRYGGTFRVNEVSEVRNLFPLAMTEVAGYHIASQVYEGLVKFDQGSLEVIPALAKSWEVNADATQWTFHLRTNARFHDHSVFEGGQGRTVTASDVAWCLHQMCLPSENNHMFWLVEGILKGARAAHDDASKSLEGVEVVNDSTLTISLEHPWAGFLSLLAHPGFFVYPKELLKENFARTAIGTGPFTLKHYAPSEQAALAKNPNYWGRDENGQPLPYLDAIQVSFVRDKKTELLQFKSGELDMIFTLPIEMYADVMGSLAEAQAGKVREFYPQVKPSMSVVYLSFQHSHGVFTDERVRHAFNLAIDREALVNYTLQGDGTPGVFGLVPPAFENFPHDRTRQIQFDPVMARSLLAEAGYPQGISFPKLELEITSGGANNEHVAEAVMKMLEDNLGISIGIKVSPLPAQLDKTESGKSLFWRENWIADYPDPENFLRLFVCNGKPVPEGEMAYLNSARFTNELYDTLYAQAVSETDNAARNELFHAMNQLLIDKAVLLPLYYEEYTRLLPAYVKNFPQNSIEYRDFSTVWFEKPSGS